MSMPINAQQQLGLKIKNILRVAGPLRADGKLGPFRSTDIQRKSGIARSTLRGLINSTKNPDLQTLERLATALNIPVAFLLMRSQDWQLLYKAINDLNDPLTASRQVISSVPSSTNIVERILEKCGVHPERTPVNTDNQSVELNRTFARNEYRRRLSQIFTILIGPEMGSESHRIFLSALAASIVNHSTPHNPQF